MNPLASLVGKPWQAGAEGPAAFDCYGLARYVMAQRGVAMPAIGFTGELLPDLARGAYELAHLPASWKRVAEPLPGCVVLMGRRGKFDPVWTHVGVWCDAERVVLHSMKGRGVVATALAGLGQLGFTAVAFYRPTA